MTSQETNEFFKSVMTDVINSMTSIFNEEGLDDTVLLDLKQIWEEKYDSIRPICDKNRKLNKPIVLNNPVTNLNQCIFSNFQQTHAKIDPHISLNQLCNVRQTAIQNPRITLVNNNSQIIIRNAVPGIRLPSQNIHNNSNNIITSQFIKHIGQLDGKEDSSSSGDDIDVEEELNIEDDVNDELDDDDAANEEELNSGDDISTPDPNEVFDCDNLILCQFNKVSRTKNLWNFNLKCGVMNIKSKDFIFGSATGVSDW